MVRRTEKRQAASRFPRTHARRHTYDVLARPNEAAAVQVLGQPVAPDDPVRGDSSARGAALSSRKEGGRGRGERGGQRSGFREGFEGARARCGSRRGCQRGEGGRCPGPDRARHAPSLSRSLSLTRARPRLTFLALATTGLLATALLLPSCFLMLPTFMLMATLILLSLLLLLLFFRSVSLSLFLPMRVHQSLSCRFSILTPERGPSLLGVKKRKGPHNNGSGARAGA